VILQMEDEPSATAVQGGVKTMFDLVRGDPQLRRDISQLDELAKLLTPTIRDRQLRVVLTGENGGVKTVLTAVAQATRAAAQFNQAQDRTNSLNQIGLALHNVQLDTALQATLDELRIRNQELQDSRARIVAAGDPA